MRAYAAAQQLLCHGSYCEVAMEAIRNIPDLKLSPIWTYLQSRNIPILEISLIWKYF